jgi:hydrogenase maturation factor
MNLDTRREQEQVRAFEPAARIYPCGAAGLAAALRETAQKEGAGANVDGERIPWLKLTLRLAKGGGESVYDADSSGCFLAVSEAGGALADHLRGLGIPATVIGKLTARPGPVLLQSAGTVTAL